MASRMWVSQRSRIWGVTANGHVPHPQPWVPALLAVGGRTTPVLLEEHPEPHLGGSEVVLGIQRAQWRIGGDALVEPLHQGHEGLVTADGVVESLQDR